MYLLLFLARNLSCSPLCIDCLNIALNLWLRTFLLLRYLNLNLRLNLDFLFLFFINLYLLLWYLFGRYYFLLLRCCNALAGKRKCNALNPSTKINQKIIEGRILLTCFSEKLPENSLIIHVKIWYFVFILWKLWGLKLSHFYVQVESILLFLFIAFYHFRIFLCKFISYLLIHKFKWL